MADSALCVIIATSGLQRDRFGWLLGMVRVFVMAVFMVSGLGLELGLLLSCQILTMQQSESGTRNAQHCCGHSCLLQAMCMLVYHVSGQPTQQVPVIKKEGSRWLKSCSRVKMSREAP